MGIKEKYYSARPDKYHDAYRDSDWILHSKNNFTSDKAAISGEDLSEHQQPVNWGGRIGLGFEDEEGFITFRMMYDFGLSNTFAGFKENKEGYTKDDMVTKQNSFLFEVGFNLSE